MLFVTLQQFGEVGFLSLDTAADADFSLVGRSTKPAAVTFDPVNQVCVIFKNCLSSLAPAPVAQSVECPLRGMGGHKFDPGLQHTKVIKNGTNCSSLGTQTYGVELGLVDPVLG